MHCHDALPAYCLAWASDCGSCALASVRAHVAAEAQGATLRHAHLLVGCGVCLAAHFATWVYAIQSTSLAHAMLFISVTPVLLAVGALVLRQPISAGQKPFK